MKHRAFQLHKEKKYSQRQVAETLGVSLGTANTWIRSIDPEEDSSDLMKLSDKCKGLPFWCGPTHIVGACKACFWGVIGEPQDRDGNKTPLFDYELEIVDAIERFQKVALVKSRSIGATQLLLIYILYRILSLQESGNYFIVSGNDWESSRGMMRRLRAILSVHNVYPVDRETVINFPSLDCRIQCYSARVASLRSWDRVKFCMVDELDSLIESQDIRSVVEAYRVKSGAALVLLTTPGKVNSTMHRIFKEKEDKCFYHRLSMPYQRSLGKLLNEKDIANLKESSPSFESEFCCLFGFVKHGNVFTNVSLKSASDKLYFPNSTRDNLNSPKSMGIDYGQTGNTGMGGGFACVVTAWEDGIVKVLAAKLWTNAEYFEILEEIRTMIQVYQPVKIWVDGSAVSFCRSLKLTPEVNEDPDYQVQIRRFREMKINYQDQMVVVPISWMKEQVGMLTNLKMLFDENCIAVSPDFDKLQVALKSAVAEGMRLDKGLSQYNDLIDALMLATNEYQMGRAI